MIVAPSRAVANTVATNSGLLPALRPTREPDGDTVGRRAPPRSDRRCAASSRYVHDDSSIRNATSSAWRPTASSSRAPSGRVDRRRRRRHQVGSRTSSGTIACRQNSHISSPLIGWPPPARPAITVAVCSTIVARRWGRPGRSRPAAAGASTIEAMYSIDRRVRGGDVVGVVDDQALGEVGEQRLDRHPARSGRARTA